jgi:hypothetical protein
LTGLGSDLLLVTSGRPLAADRCLALSGCPHFYDIFIFYFLFFIFVWKFGEWSKALGRMGVQHPHFLKLALALGIVKCSILHGDWRFYFFLNLFFKNL